MHELYLLACESVGQAHAVYLTARRRDGRGELELLAWQAATRVRDALYVAAVAGVRV